jgi:hypothetical protein
MWPWNTLSGLTAMNSPNSTAKLLANLGPMKAGGGNGKQLAMKAALRGKLYPICNDGRFGPWVLHGRSRVYQSVDFLCGTSTETAAMDQQLIEQVQGCCRNCEQGR